MDRNTELKYIIKAIKEQLSDLERKAWDVYVEPSEFPENVDSKNYYYVTEREDKKTYLFYGTRMLYYKINLFLEYKNLPYYLDLFKSKFSNIIDNPEAVRKTEGPKYDESEPSMIILEDFSEFLYSFEDFDYKPKNEIKHNKLKLLLSETNNILAQLKTKITNETSIYNSIKWFIEIIYPSLRKSPKGYFVKKYGTYNPDILIPEINSAVEYKFIRKGESPNKFLDQLKIDADNYTGDREYKYYYAVVFFEDKTELTQASFNLAVKEKSYPSNWVIIAL